MNKYISISIFRVSGDGKYLDMVFSCPQDYYFTSLIIKVKYFDEYKKEHSASYDLSPAVFTQHDYKYVLQLPLEKLGIKYPAIYEGSFKAEKECSNIITIENGLELSAGTNTFKVVDDVHDFLWLKNTDNVQMNIFLNDEEVEPSGDNGNIYNIYNIQYGDIVKIVTEEATTLETVSGETVNALEDLSKKCHDEISDTAVCSDVSYAYRCMMDDLFMNEGTCEDLIPDSILRKYLLLYGHTAAMVAGDLDTSTEYFKLIGNCFAKCPSKDRGKGSCCSGSCNDKPIRPVHHSCNCGRL